MAAQSLVSSSAGIEARGLVKTFSGPEGLVHAVRDVDLSIGRGETVALLGPNGAGKTTTIDMLLGLLEPDAGSVAVLGRKPVAAVAGGLISGMLQTGALLRDLSVRELVAMMAALYPRPLDVDQVIELTGLDGIAVQKLRRLSTSRATVGSSRTSSSALLTSAIANRARCVSPPESFCVRRSAMPSRPVSSITWSTSSGRG